MKILKKFVFIAVFLLLLSSVYAQTSNVNFVVTDVEPKVLNIDKDEFLNITLKNLGTDFATQVEVEILQNNYVTPIGSTTFYTKKAREAFESEQFFGAVLQGEEIKASFLVHVNDVSSGSYLVPIKVRYRNPSMVVEEKTFYIGIKLVGSPNIVISGINTSPDIIYPDKDFKLSIILENIGKEVAKGVKLKLLLPEHFSGERLAYIGSLERDKWAVANFNLKTSKNIESGLYNFTLIIEYMCNGRTFKERKNFEIYVAEKERPKLEISSIDVSPEKGEKLFPGSSFTLSIQFENIGKQKARSIKAVLEYPGEFQGEKISFLGSLEEDDTATAIYDLKVSDNALSGSYTFKVFLTYYDEAGKIYKDEKEFEIYVEARKKSIPIPILLLISALIIIIAYRKIKRKREIEE